LVGLFKDRTLAYALEIKIVILSGAKNPRI
jgi:hypothetical protein